MAATRTSESKEMSAGNLGLCTALSIAYDILEESSCNSFDLSPLYSLNEASVTTLGTPEDTASHQNSSWQGVTGLTAVEDAYPAFLTPITPCLQDAPDSTFHLASLPPDPESGDTFTSALSTFPSSGSSQQNCQCSEALKSPESNSRPSQTTVSATSTDDALYELSADEVKKIDDMLSTNAQVTSSRHWKYYTETNEWTRATCALMACLFSRDQMANSTVLGRGGSQREKLPTTMVAYVVTKMRRRFNKSAAAVRARMAQKCKDERRFGRVLPAHNNGLVMTKKERPTRQARRRPEEVRHAATSTVATGLLDDLEPFIQSRGLAG